MENLIEALSTLSLLEWIIITVIWLVTNAIIYLSFTKWVFGRLWRLYKNLKRPVIVLTPISESGATIASGEMKNEVQLLKSNGLLNISSDESDFRTFNPAGKHCIVVIGYLPGMIGINDLLTRIKSKHVPLIVYTYGNNRIDDKDKKMFDEYPFVLFANFPLTLLNHIFSTVASYPYESK